MINPNSGALNKRPSGFTLVEMLTVMAIIAVLAALVLGASGYVQKKGARARTEATLKAIGSALESYKADNAVYPRDAATDALDSRSQGDPAAYAAANLYMYKAISGDPDADRKSTEKSYYSFPVNMLFPKDSASPVQYVPDAFGSAFGYSTAYSAELETNATKTPPVSTPPTKGYNPTYDLWSTAGKTKAPGGSPDVTLEWVTNW